MKENTKAQLQAPIKSRIISAKRILQLLKQYEPAQSEAIFNNFKKAYYSIDGKFYNPLSNNNDFPAILFDADGYLIIERMGDLIANPNLLQNKKLHTKKNVGISKLSGYVQFTAGIKQLIHQ
jgi:hypothetical protein